jgi:hypothetical protein
MERCEMHDRAFQVWRRERDAVEQEMNRLITACRSISVEERQVRRFQFEALVERREAAARKLLQSDHAARAASTRGQVRRKAELPRAPAATSMD